MARIKVTGWIDTDDLRPGEVDLDHPMGVSGDFYDAIITGVQPLPRLDDLDFTLEADEPEPERHLGGPKKKGL